MKIKFGSLVTDGRGKIGGHVASKNRGGAYLRTKVTPSNPQTVAQSLVRGILTFFAQAWRSLTEAQRTAWNEAVDSFTSTDIFGDIKKPSGENLYVKLNANLAEAQLPSINTPPLPAEVIPPGPSSGAAAQTGQSFDVNFQTSPVPANTRFIVKATEQMSPGINYMKGRYRTVQILQTGNASPFDISAAYIAKFGALVAGQKIGIEITPINETTGQKGASFRNVLIVGA